MAIKLYSLHKAAKMTGLTYGILAYAVKKGQLPHSYKCDKRPLFDLQDIAVIDAWKKKLYPVEATPIIEELPDRCKTC